MYAVAAASIEYFFGLNDGAIDGSGREYSGDVDPVVFFEPMKKETQSPLALCQADSFMSARLGNTSAFVFPYRLAPDRFPHIMSASISPIFILKCFFLIEVSVVNSVSRSGVDGTGCTSSSARCAT